MANCVYCVYLEMPEVDSGTRWELHCGHPVHGHKSALPGEHGCEQYMRAPGSDDDLGEPLEIASKAYEGASKAFSAPTRRHGVS